MGVKSLFVTMALDLSSVDMLEATFQSTSFHQWLADL